MVGAVLKHYLIETELGKGGMGVVYRARDTRLGRLVALKMITPGLVANPERRSRLLLEARSAAAVSHPAIAQVYDIDEVDGNLFIAMEYVDGRTVSRLIADGELDLLGAIEIALQIAEGLAKAHDAGILHRDIKSDNIMVTRDGHAKLLDFGLAKLVEPEPDEPVSPVELARTLTRGRVQTIPGAVMGTLSYMSPEQARGRELDRRSDIFSLGIVLYEMVTAELPFKGETPLDTMHAIAYEEARPVTLVRRNLTPELHRIVFRCLRKNPDDRYPDAHALADDLRRLKRDLETGTTTRLPAGDRLRHWAERLRISFPGGYKGMAILFGAIALTVVLVAVRFNWGGLIGPAFIVLFVYRFLRNRKKRRIAAFTKKLSKFPEVRLVTVRDDRVTVVVDKAPAKVYIRITALVDDLNRSLFFGRDIKADIKTEIPESEARTMLTQVGVVYAREEGHGKTGKKDSKG
ncbi:MAG TPA: serine/threonine-protein kinase [Acidobacteriota bacterium]|nr:serine/threonine-protein kinase [Acidobacteriota bacterium]